MGYITHEEATIKSFMRDPEYAKSLLSEVIKDGDENEIAYFQYLYDEAQVHVNYPRFYKRELPNSSRLRSTRVG